MKKRCYSGFAQDKVLEWNAEIDKERTYVLPVGNIIIVAPNIGFLTEREYSFTAPAEEEIGRDVMEKRSYIGFDYDTVLNWKAEIDKESTHVLPVGKHHYVRAEQWFPH